jgi:hypothetical protein
MTQGVAMTLEGVARTHEVAMTPHAVIARRAAPWQSMPSHHGPWIASFLAMTKQGVARTHHAVIARRGL